MNDRVTRIQRIMERGDALMQTLNHGRDRAWLGVELTMPQLKALLCVARYDGAPSGEIARNLGVGLSTITGIVDRLAEHGLVVRREDVDDRRITRVLATPAGHALVDELIRYRNELIFELLSTLDEAQLTTVESAFTSLVDAAARLSAQRAVEVSA